MKIYGYQWAVIFWILFQFHASGTVLYVDLNSGNPTPPYADWSTAATNIQDAVDASCDGDQILVTNGIYQTGGRVVYGSLTNRVVVNKAVTVQSVNGTAVTMIQGNPVIGDSAVRCVYMTNNATLVGFTLSFGGTRNGGDFMTEVSGGGVWCESTNALILNCSLVNNVATLIGGAVFSGKLVNCTLMNNTALGSGPAYGGGAAYGSVLNCCIVSSNVAANGTGGAAIASTLNYCIVSSNVSFAGAVYESTANNCLFTANGTTNGIHPSQIGAANSSTLNNCTIAGNVSAAGFGAVYNCTLANSIIDDNNGLDCYHCILTNCCAGSLYWYCFTVNTFSVPPGFVNLAAGDFHLQPNSPCINGGSNLYVVGTDDLDGNPRITGYVVDIGAYEFQTPGLIVPYLWAMQHGLPSTDGSLDTDHDGMNNWQEWRAGTNPGDPHSVLKMTSMLPATNPPGLVVTWQSVSNINYFLQSSTNLGAPPAFSTIQSNIVGQAGTTSYTDTTATNSGPYFYRVGVQ